MLFCSVGVKDTESWVGRRVVILTPTLRRRVVLIQKRDSQDGFLKIDLRYGMIRQSSHREERLSLR